MGAGDDFDFYAYASDNGYQFSLKLTALVASQGGFTSKVDPRVVAPWPFGPKNVRHVYGVTTTGKRTRLPIATNSQTLYVSGGTFTLAAGTYTVEGAIGEKRKLNAIA